MRSNLALATLAEFRAQGLDPTDADVILLNAMGLRVELRPDLDGLAGCPRVAFLGDLVLREPTVAHQFYIDEALSVLGKDLGEFERLAFVAYVLNDRETVPVTRPRRLKKSLRRFIESDLLSFTASELVAAINYVYTGADPVALEHPAPTKKERELAEKRRELGDDFARSAARRLIAEAGVLSIPADVALRTTLPTLELMIGKAAALRGAKIDKDGAVADFYRTADEIAERLRKEKEAKQ